MDSSLYCLVVWDVRHEVAFRGGRASGISGHSFADIRPKHVKNLLTAHTILGNNRNEFIDSKWGTGGWIVASRQL
jgi:hypothetical protein